MKFLILVWKISLNQCGETIKFEVTVEAAISLSFDSFSILTEFLEIHFWTFLDFLNIYILIFVWKIYVDGSMGILS